MELKDKILQDLSDAKDIIESLALMPEKQLWKFILTGGFDVMPAEKASMLLMGLTLRFRAAIGTHDTFEFDMPTDEEIAEGYGVSVDEIRAIRRVLLSR